MSDQSPEENNSEASSRPKTSRRWIWLSILCVLLLAIYFAPSILLSTQRQWAADKLSEETNLQIGIGGLTGGWFSPIKVTDVSIKTKSNETFAQVEKIQTEKSILGLLMRDIEVGGIAIKNPQVRLPLEGEMADELLEVAENIDPKSGLLGQIVNPDRDAILQLQIDEGSVELRPTDDDEWAQAVNGLQAVVDINHKPEKDHLQIQLSPTELQLTPETADYGLRFVAPVLAGAVDLNGKSTLEIKECDLVPTEFKDMKLEGSLTISEANADVQAKLLQAIAKLFAKTDEQTTDLGNSLDTNEESESLVLKIAQDNRVDFSVADGTIHHEGLAFGLPDVLPNVKLTSHGNVGFDETLDFEVGLTLPFEKMGEGSILQKIGTPSLKVPVTGTFQEPDVGIGQGKMLGGLVRDVVDSVSDGKVDVDPLLQKIKDMEILKNRREEKAAAETDTEEKPREGILGRLRNRLRGRNESKEPEEREDDSQ